jgi:hypothetical protein
MAYEPRQGQIITRLGTPEFRNNPSSLLMDPLYISAKRQLFISLMNSYNVLLLHLIMNIPYYDSGLPIRAPPAVIVGGAASALICSYPFDTPDIDVQLASLDNPEEGEQSTYRDGSLLPSYAQYMNFIFNEIVKLLRPYEANMGPFAVLENITDIDIIGDSELAHIHGDPIIIGSKLYVCKLTGIGFRTAGTTVYTSKIIIIVKYGGYTERILEMKFPTYTNKDITSYIISPQLFVSTIPTLLEENLYVLNEKLQKMRRAMLDYDGKIRELIDHPEAGDTLNFNLKREKEIRLEILTYKVRIHSHFFRIDQLLFQLHNQYLVSRNKSISTYYTNFRQEYFTKLSNHLDLQIVRGHLGQGGVVPSTFAWSDADKASISIILHNVLPTAGGVRRKQKQTKKINKKRSKLLKQTKRR